MQQLLKFIESKFTWPLLVNPGRRTGKTSAAVALVKELSKYGHRPLLVMPNRTLVRAAENELRHYPRIKVSSIVQISEVLMGSDYTVVIFDEPGLSVQDSSHYIVPAVERGIPAIIFGSS